MSATSSPGDAVRRTDHTASPWLDLAEGRLRFDRLSRNGGRIDFLPLGFAHSSRGKKVYRRHPPLRSGPRTGASPIAFGLPIAIETAVVAGSETARRNDMANIGSFKKSGNEFQGEIVTLSLQTKNVRIVPETTRGNDVLGSEERDLDQQCVTHGRKFWAIRWFKRVARSTNT